MRNHDANTTHFYTILDEENNTIIILNKNL